MSGDAHRKGPHDIGGEEAGPIDTTDHGMKFWEKQANALRSTLSRAGLVKVDELRRAAESLGDEYRKLAYFEVTTSALRTLLIEKGLITQDELEAKMAEVRRRFSVPDEQQSPIKKKAKR
jgi:nitrile hydratase subunit beta